MPDAPLTRADLVERIGAAIEQAPSVTMRVNKMRDDGLIYEIIAIDLPLDVGEEIVVLDAVGNPDQADDSQARWQGIIAARAALAAIHAAGCAVVGQECSAHALAASIMKSSNTALDRDKPVAAAAVLQCSGGRDMPGEGAMVEHAAILAQDYRIMIAAADLAKEDA